MANWHRRHAESLQLLVLFCVACDDVMPIASALHCPDHKFAHLTPNSMPPAASDQIVYTRIDNSISPPKYDIVRADLNGNSVVVVRNRILSTPPSAGRLVAVKPGGGLEIYDLDGSLVRVIALDKASNALVGVLAPDGARLAWIENQGAEPGLVHLFNMLQKTDSSLGVFADSNSKPVFSPSMATTFSMPVIYSFDGTLLINPTSQAAPGFLVGPIPTNDVGAPWSAISWSSKGAGIAFTVPPLGDAISDIGVVSLLNGAYFPVNTLSGMGGICPEFSTDEKIVYFSCIVGQQVGAIGTRTEICQVTMSSMTTAKLTNFGDVNMAPSALSDARLLLLLHGPTSVDALAQKLLFAKRGQTADTSEFELRVFDVATLDYCVIDEHVHGRAYEIH